MIIRVYLDEFEPVTGVGKTKEKKTLLANVSENTFQDACISLMASGIFNNETTADGKRSLKVYYPPKKIDKILEVVN